MCGRGACTLSVRRCRRVAGGGTVRKVRNAEKFRPRYNVGPQGYVPVVRNVTSIAFSASGAKDGETPQKNPREVCMMRWGLVPAFAKRSEDYDVFKGGSSTFNARVESVESSGLWRRLIDTKRCVVLFDGFFEWKTVGKTKTPMFIRHLDNYDGHAINGIAAEAEEPPADQAEAEMPSLDEDGPVHAPLLFAGLYDVWRGELGDGEEMETVTILTMEPDGTPMWDVHDRMPVFLTPETAARWLDTSEKYSKIISTVVRASQEHAQRELFIYEVSPLVSNVRNESPDCILPKQDYNARQLKQGIGRFFQKKNVKTGVGQLPPQEDALCGKRKPIPEPERAAKASKVTSELVCSAEVSEVIELD